MAHDLLYKLACHLIETCEADEAFDFEEVLRMTTVDGKTLLVIEVFLSNSRPHYLRSEGPETGVYVRLGSTNRQADRDLIGELRRSVEGFSFDQLPKAVDEVMLFLKKHAYRGADLSEVRRKDVWSIPLGILREVIINALVHSDYSQRGAPIRVVFLDDRIEVESMGILLPGLTVEDMKQGASRIRNPVIARVFKELHLIEQWGTGVRRIFEEARELGLPEPKIEEIAMRLRFTVYLAKSHHLQIRTTEQVEAQVNVRILKACAKRPLSSAEIAAALGHKTLSGNVRKVLPALREAGLLEYTIPDKPNSRLQKFRLTETGLKHLSAEAVQLVATIKKNVEELGV